MDSSLTRWLFPVVDNHPFHAAHWVKSYRLGHLQIVETAGKEHETLTKLIVQLALRGPFNLIAGDEWLPDRDTLTRSVRRYTVRVTEILDNPRLRRPMTCLQLLDLLMAADQGNRPTLITNFLHHFYNAYITQFSQPDSIIPNLYNPQSLNRYSYVLGNPIRYNDPTGHMCSDPEDPTPSCDGSSLQSTKVGNKVVRGSGLNAGKPKTKKPKGGGGGDKPLLAQNQNPNSGGNGGDGGQPLLMPTPSLNLPPSPFDGCEWTDCILSIISTAASGAVWVFEGVPEISGPAFVVDLGVTYVAYNRTNKDYHQGKISQERQWVLNGTGIAGVLPIPFFGFAFSVVNMMATFSGAPP